MLAAARTALAAHRATLGRARLQDPLPPGPSGLVVSALAVQHLDGGVKADLFRRVHAVPAPRDRFVLADPVVPEDPSDVMAEID